MTRPRLRTCTRCVLIAIGLGTSDGLGCVSQADMKKTIIRGPCCAERFQSNVAAEVKGIEDLSRSDDNGAGTALVQLLLVGSRRDCI